MKKLLCVAILGLAVIVATRVAAEDKKKIKEISEIMEAHKGQEKSFLNKVCSGDADKADVEKLLALYVDLGKNKPPKGSAEEWKKRTDALVAATKKLAADPKSKDACTALKKAANCMACHDAHKED